MRIFSPMSKTKILYLCNECGHESVRWLGQCPSCKAWNSFSEFKVKPEHVASSPKRTTDETTPLCLEEIGTTDHLHRFSSGIAELDRMLGGGFMHGSFLLLGGDPGIGKSTLMLQIGAANPTLKMLYATGEESAVQVKQRAQRLGLRETAMKVLASADLTVIMNAIATEKPELLIVDSIQTLFSPENPSLPGTVPQIRECCMRLQRLAKETGTVVLAVGHITKDGELAGPKLLEHMVDTVLQFEGDESGQYRLLRALKNRFGATGELAVFAMRAHGLEEILNPSALFIDNFDAANSGNVLTCTMEGSRPLLVEVQALVTDSFYGYPQRNVNGFDGKRLAMLLAVLEQRLGMELGRKDVYVNLVGGMKAKEPAVDLAVCAAVYSAYHNRPLFKKGVFVGEVGLGAEVRAVSQLEHRIQEALKMGMDLVVLPSGNVHQEGQVSRVSYLGDLADLFN
jgi:DNA repair protein RadA/Sms